MAANIKHKEIQVQKPAQSLQAFQAKLASGQDVQSTILKPVLISVGIVLVLALSIFGFMAWRSSVVEKFETALANIVQETKGTSQTPLPAAEEEKRMREALPKLEALAKTAPGSSKEIANAMIASWKLQLDSKGVVAPTVSDPWSRIRSAQRLIALGQGTEALSTLSPLRSSATPDQAWAEPFWNTMLEVRRLQGDREQAWKDFADYKERFKEKADTSSMEHVLSSI
jgi:hypothetical protein